MAAHILIVDDDPHMRASLQMELEAEGFQVTVAPNGLDAIELAGKKHFDLVLCDVRMPDIDGIETITAIKEVQPVTKTIIITGYASQDTPISALKLKVDDYLMKPFPIDSLTESIKTALERSGKGPVPEGPSKYHQSFLKIITGMLFETRIPHLAGHSERVARMSMRIGRRLGFTPAHLQNIFLAALLHDIGYADLPPQMLEKKKFQEGDYDLVRDHPRRARELLSPFTQFRDIATVIFCHHERWDGRGYPQGLAADKIPLESRIIAVAEAYDSLVSERPHKTKRSSHEALKLMEKESGSSFDPSLVAILPSLIEEDGREEEAAGDLATSNEEDRAAVLVRLGDLYRERGAFDIAQQAYDEAEALLTGQDSAGLLIGVLVGRASLLHRQGRTDEALDEARKAQALARSKSLQIQDAQAALMMAHLKILKNDIQGAEELLSGAREIFSLWESASHVGEADFLLSSLHALEGDAGSEAFFDLFTGFLAARSPEIVNKYRDVAHLPLGFAISRGIFRDEIAGLLRQTDASKEILERMLEWVNPLAKPAVKALADGMEEREKDRPVKTGGGAPVRKSDALIQVFFFGKFRVAAGDQVLSEEAWTTRKAKSLFAYLSSRLGEAESEERLMELFWLEGSTNARHALHNCITVVRKIFMPFLGSSTVKIIQKKKTGYYLNREIGCLIDLEGFQWHYHRGRALFEQGSLNEGLTELQKAEELYTGNFMEGSYDEWSDNLRLVTRNNYLELMHTLGMYFFEKEKYQVCMEYWKKALAADNCFEDAYQGLMLSHAALDNRNEAIRIYHQCVQTLKKELDLTAPPKLMEIYYRLVDGQKVPLLF